MSKLLAGSVMFVLCTLTVEERERQPLSSVRPAEQARLMHGELFYLEQHPAWEAESPHAELPGTRAVPPPVPNQRGYVYSALHCAPGLSPGLVWKQETFGIPLQQGKDLVDAGGERDAAAEWSCDCDIQLSLCSVP